MPGTPTIDVAQAYAVRLMQHLVVPTFVLDSNRTVVVWNRACERLTGLPASVVIGTSEHWRAFYDQERYCLADLVPLRQPEKVGELSPEHTVSQDGLGLSAENWCVMPNLGSQLYLAIDAGPIHDDEGNLLAVVETLRDMTDHKRAEAALRALASSDGLTGLANRRSFDRTLMLEWERAQRSKRPFSLLLADVDYFKRYNDFHGHQKGDECLRIVGSLIGRVARPGDLSARYGGEEFAIVMPETDHADACALAKKLQDIVSNTSVVHGASELGPFLTLSMGVATLEAPTSDVGPDSLLNKADQALYAAKNSGRDRIVSAHDTLKAFANAARPQVRRIGGSSKAS